MDSNTNLPRAGRAAPVLAVLVTLAGLVGCEWDGQDRVLAENRRPSIEITGGATEGGTADYRVEFFWFASDPDGFVSFFQYAIDDTCLCRYEVEVPVQDPSTGETVLETSWIESMDPDSCRARGIEPAYESPDSIWRRTDGYSGTFQFSATMPMGGDPPRASDWHRFFIRAVDDRGATSVSDTRYFNAQTIAPSARLLTPVGRGFEKSRTVSPFVTIRWLGRDDDSTDSNKKPVGYQLKMVPLNSIYEPDDLVLRYLTSQFIARRNVLIPETLLVENEEDLGPDTYLETDWWPKRDRLYEFETIQLRNIVPENYAFAVRAVDQAGAVMPDGAHALSTEEVSGSVVKLDVNASVPVRPFITIQEENILGEQVFIADGEEWRVEVPVNTPLRFRWTVDTSHYGARPAGTNYAFDIPDPGCDVCQQPDGIGGWLGWGAHDGTISDISFTDAQAGEQHILYVRARDESFSPERETLALVVMDVIGFSFEEPAVWVDDFKAAGTNDCDHDSFIRSILEPAVAPYLGSGEELPVYQARRRTGDCQESSTPTIPKLSTLSRYQTLYWNAASASGVGTALGGVTDPSRDSRTGRYLSIYLRAGGNLVVWGRATVGAMLGDLYPQDTGYTPELPLFSSSNFGPGSFLWDVMKVRTRMDQVGRAAERTLAPSCSGIIGMEATEAALAEGFPPGVPDPTGYDPTRTALWIDNWFGERNPWGAVGANGFYGQPPVRVAGMDTLYTYVSNSWSYEQGGGYAIREACGTAFLSPFEQKPVVLRYRDPLGRQGKAAWIMTPLHVFQSGHTGHLSELMARLTDWLFVVD